MAEEETCDVGLTLAKGEQNMLVDNSHYGY
jgi:hypothetical protein